MAPSPQYQGDMQHPRITELEAQLGAAAEQHDAKARQISELEVELAQLKYTSCSAAAYPPLMPPATTPAFGYIDPNDPDVLYC